ncbi:hypothetical protein [Alteromonas sp. CYL-A6]|uniref:hypothetical protein n=1 Tax=Alteromonas nitratireducens TaxID=3390813 RepID=UPI0034A905B4
MAIPLLWLGAGLAAAYAGKEIAREKQVADGHIRHFPGKDARQVTPVDGALVCCGIYEIFQHTGIWVDNHIVELNGNGLVRAISPGRFLSQRSGSRIYVACHTTLQPMVDDAAARRAMEKVFQYQDYDVISNNCHRFSLACITGRTQPVTRFASLNEAIRDHFQDVIHWQPASIPSYLL